MQRSLAWRKVESRFMDMEISWRHQDQARHIVWQRYLQLSMLAEVSGFLAFFQMIVLYEQPLPSPADARLEPVVLCLWGVLSISVACAAVCCMFLCALMSLSMLARGAADGLEHVQQWGAEAQASPHSPERDRERRELHLWDSPMAAVSVRSSLTRETLPSVSSASLERTHSSVRIEVPQAPELSQQEVRSLHAPPYVPHSAAFHRVTNPDGKLLTKEHADAMWDTNFRDRFQRTQSLILRVLLPAFFINLCLAAYVKLYTWPWACWTSVALIIVLCVWWAGGILPDEQIQFTLSVKKLCGFRGYEGAAKEEEVVEEKEKVSVQRPPRTERRGGR